MFLGLLSHWDKINQRNQRNSINQINQIDKKSERIEQRYIYLENRGKLPMVK
jgi:hypothetical protein